MTTDTVGGVWAYSLELSAGLLKAGMEVSLVSFGRLPNELQARQVNSVRGYYPSHFLYIPTDFPLEWMQGEPDLDKGKAFLDRLISSYRPAILHTNQFCHGDLTSPVPRIVVAHSDVISWWHAKHSPGSGEVGPSGAWFARYRSLVAAGIRGADAVVAPTQWQLAQLARHYGNPGSRGVAIPNAAHARDEGPARRMQTITAGRIWDECKNIGILEEADLPVPSFIAGDLSQSPHLAVAPNSHRNVYYLGEIDHASLSGLFEMSEIYVGPSLYEPFGLAPLEAAHAGCALVLSDLESFREIWEDAASYFDPRDPKCLRQTVNHLSQNPAVCRKMGERARERARDLYGVDLFTDRYLTLYSKVIASSRLSHAA